VTDESGPPVRPVLLVDFQGIEVLIPCLLGAYLGVALARVTGGESFPSVAESLRWIVGSIPFVVVTSAWSVWRVEVDAGELRVARVLPPRRTRTFALVPGMTLTIQRSRGFGRFRRDGLCLVGADQEVVVKLRAGSQGPLILGGGRRALSRIETLQRQVGSGKHVE
jgi:hypothetical protein